MTTEEIDAAVALHKRLIPQGTQVASKGWFRWCEGFGPRFITDAQGVTLTDERDRNYTDWTMGLGAITLGHRWVVSEREACAFPIPTMVEGRLAQTVNRMVPCAEKIRFLKTGTDATTACVRLARVFTGRAVIATCGMYHGWQDWSLDPSKEGLPDGIRAYTQRIPYNDLEALEHALNATKPACLIMEAVSLTAPKPGYLNAVRNLCWRENVVLIFDEVITGFRLAPGGAQQHYGVTPDLCAMGKGMANGWPISLVAGRADIMDCWERTHISGTYFADSIPMGAAEHTLQTMVAERFWMHQNLIGSALRTNTEKIISLIGLQNECKVVGHDHWWVLQIPDDEHQTLWQQEVLRGGIMSSGSHFVCLDHNLGHVETTLAVYRKAFQVLKDAIDKNDVAQRLECAVNKSVFRRA